MMGQKYVHCISKRLETQEYNNSPLLHYLVSGDEIQERVEGKVGEVWQWKHIFFAIIESMLFLSVEMKTCWQTVLRVP